ncbi:helix-turn-helix domain-containing protein [Micromonospora lupini]|uniref:hypothetical protein n=1 Tax=Micromonospora lupini TaxID=285679 RepID=UPI00225A1C77|nr:hypothetical protein [Micromonospora lupini]MCX5070843.1 helix-turn-helix domain-containing protein [Micromonospora lupini]
MTPEAMTGTQPGRGFAMVPAWLVWKQPTANALTVYVHLALYGTFNPGTATYEQCRPSKRTLAKGDPKKGYPGTGLSESTVGRALRELEALNAIKGEEQYDPATGAQLPTVYRLIFGQVVEETAAQTPVSPVTPPPRVTSDTPSPHVTGDTPPPITSEEGAHVTGDTPPVSPVTHNQEPHTKNHLTQSSDHPADDRRGGDGELLDEPIQMSLDGAIPAPRKGTPKKTAKAPKPQREPSTHDVAMGIARDWIAYNARHNTPIAGSQVQHRLASLVKPFLEHFSEREIKFALNDLRSDGVPSTQAMQRVLNRRRGVQPQQQNRRPAQAAGTLNVNDAWSDGVTTRPAMAGAATGGDQW